MGLSDAAFKKIVRQWVTTAKHPRFKRPYIDLVYQPMLQLLHYLRANGFKIFIVSGGGIDFMRAFVPERYGIPAYRIIGSYADAKLENGQILKLPKVAFIDDGPNKPIAIYRNIGKRPIFACGNSDRDLPMLQYSAAGEGKSMQVYIHHTDAVRAYAYDRETHVGRLDKGLDEAKAKGWVVVDMKHDWKRIFSFEQK